MIIFTIIFSKPMARNETALDMLGPGRVLRVPQEGNVLILESEVHFSGLKVGHLSNLVFRRGWSGGRSGTGSHVWR